MDERYVGRDLKELYQYSFRQYLAEWTSLDPDEQPEPLGEDPELSDFQLDRLDDLRFGIKKDRDKYFVDNQYDEWGVEGVPKSFWLSGYEIEEESDSVDEMSQSVLDNF